MITLTPQEAVNLMNAQFLATLQDGRALALLGYLPDVVWGSEKRNTKPDATLYWLRVSHQLDVDNKQANLSNCEGTPGQARFRSSGLTYVQLFAPTSDKTVEVKSLQLGTICRSAFRGPARYSGDNAVWFRNAKINNLDPENELYRLNVVTEHEYDELG